MKEVHLFVHCVIMWNNARWLGKKNNETCSVEQKYFLCRSGFLSIAIFSIVLTVLKNHFGSNATPYRNFASLPTAGLEKHKLQLNIKYAAFWFIFWNYLFILNIFTFNLYTTGFQKNHNCDSYKGRFCNIWPVLINTLCWPVALWYQNDVKTR